MVVVLSTDTGGTGIEAEWLSGPDFERKTAFEPRRDSGLWRWE